MKKYQYQIIRYQHDQFTGEFINLGVVVYSSDNNFLKSKITTKFQRISSIFPSANVRFIKKMLSNFEIELEKITNQLNEIFKPSVELSNITHKILPKDDSALQLTETKYGIDLDFDMALDYLFNSLVGKYIENENSNTISDDDVWKMIYKKYFDKYGITNRLTKHEITTSDDVFSFDKSWKNEIWHCYQPLSFSLQNKDYIKDKVYKWAGKIQEINNSEESIRLTFLTSLNAEHLELKDFINKHLSKNEVKLNIEVISEFDAEVTVKRIQEQMLEHDKQSNLI